MSPEELNRDNRIPDAVFDAAHLPDVAPPEVLIAGGSSVNRQRIEQDQTFRFVGFDLAGGITDVYALEGPPLELKRGDLLAYLPPLSIDGSLEHRLRIVRTRPGATGEDVAWVVEQFDRTPAGRWTRSTAPTPPARTVKPSPNRATRRASTRRAQWRHR